MFTDWDGRYVALAREISSWSKDPSTQCGAVIVGDSGQVLSQGYNGFPRGMSDLDELYAHRETKYKRISHAEMNAIYNASRTGVSLYGSTIYVYGLPVCHECAKAIIQVGIKKVVMQKEAKDNRWNDSCDLAQIFFGEAGVETTYISSLKQFSDYEEYLNRYGPL
jgi:dCMP deaminase